MKAKAVNNTPEPSHNPVFNLSPRTVFDLSMAGISISLPTSTNVNPEKQSLKYLITRINEQKGGFRNVSEQSLEEEIAAGTDDDAMFDDETNSRSDEDVEDIKSKRERVSKAREEMLKQIGYDISP